MSLFFPYPESLLHYVWEGLRFDLTDLRTTQGELVEVGRPGRLNRDQGPDFLGAELRIAGLAWHGQVEIHIEGEDWYRHQHERDPLYGSVVLHVVHTPSRRPPRRPDGTEIPELVLGDRLPAALLRRYEALQTAEGDLPCQGMIDAVPQARVLRWLDRLAVERMQQKATQFQASLEAQVQDWEQVVWEALARFVGGPVNGDALADLARRVPTTILRKERSRRLVLEALLFGAAGMLPQRQDAYIEVLQGSWHHLQAKYQISPFRYPIKYLRMRPAAFPTLRLAQLAALWEQIPSLLQLLEPAGIRTFLTGEYRASEYWDRHYRFGEESQPRPKRLGKAQQAILAVNVLLPLGLLYQRAHGRGDPAEWLEALLLELPAEQNRHTRVFTALGWTNQHALHAQAMIQLHKQYCQPKRCLDCHLGKYLLQRE